MKTSIKPTLIIIGAVFVSISGFSSALALTCPKSFDFQCYPDTSCGKMTKCIVTSAVSEDWNFAAPDKIIGQNKFSVGDIQSHCSVLPKRKYAAQNQLSYEGPVSGGLGIASYCLYSVDTPGQPTLAGLYAVDYQHNPNMGTWKQPEKGKYVCVGADSCGFKSK
ncbi:hypothetical protein BH10PSE19_BH10PSE19_09500 [soil metagenome]